MSKVQSASAQRALATILPLIQASPPQYYSAHQKARTSASRLCKPPTSRKPDYDGAIELLFESARELMKVGERGSGVDLATYMVDVEEMKGSSQLSDSTRERIFQLIALTGSEGAWRKTLIDKAILCTIKLGPYPTGDPALHHYIGEIHYKEGAFAIAQTHFLQSASKDASRLFGKMMAEWYVSVSDSKVSAGVFATHGVIPFLLSGSLLAATSFLSSFVSTLSASSSPVQFLPTVSNIAAVEMRPTSDPVVNFLQLALLTIPKAPTPSTMASASTKPAREAWIRLCGTYQSRGGLLATPEYRKALQQIAHLYFGFPAAKDDGANPMGDLMASLFGGGGSPTNTAWKLADPLVAAMGEAAGLD